VAVVESPPDRGSGRKSMRMRRLQVAVRAVFVAVAALAASTTCAAPNVVVILADDLGN
jgi:hypothetical protein